MSLAPKFFFVRRDAGARKVLRPTLIANNPGSVLKASREVGISRQPYNLYILDFLYFILFRCKCFLQRFSKLVIDCTQ